MSRALMIQGTGSNVGKSLIVAGLARALTKRGLSVRPFKPQNMSNNAAVAAGLNGETGEIGRAQALQAMAAGVAPHVHMNPVLLKPQTETGSQIVVQGKVWGAAKARELAAVKPKLLPMVLESFNALKSETDIVLVEGAGSASEINLRKADIANMGFARAADVPVILLGDIDRGGVIASVVGTQAVCDPADAAMIKGFIINRMRGDKTLFEDGMREIATRTGWQALGLVPNFEAAATLPAEDAFELAEMSAQRRRQKIGAKTLKIAVPLLPRIANFDDLDPLGAEPHVDLVIVPKGQALPGDADVVILPGSKATIADLHALRAEGWDIDLLAHHRRGGHVLGVCGGYQMLGRTIADPDGIEGPAETVPGLSLLDVETVLAGEKRTTLARGSSLGEGGPLTGYEIHMGETAGPDTQRPLHRLSDGRLDGAATENGKVQGTYIHGLFTDDAQRARWLSHWGGEQVQVGYGQLVEDTLDALAAHLEEHADLDALIKLAR